jgi:hypothetical protein
MDTTITMELPSGEDNEGLPVEALPRTLEEAQDALNELFGGSLSSKASLSHVLTILKAHPKLALEAFAFSCPKMQRSLWERRVKREAGLRQSLSPNNIPVKLSPLCHVLKSPAADLATVQDIAELAPAVIKTWDTTDHGLLPLHVACFYSQTATEDIVKFLSTLYPNAITRAGKNVGVPFGVYMEQCILRKKTKQQQRTSLSSVSSDGTSGFEDNGGAMEEDFFESNHKELCEVLLAGDYFSSSGIVNILTRAIQANCPPLIRYLTAKASQSVWENEFIVTARNFEIQVAKGMEVMVQMSPSHGPSNIKISYDKNMTKDAFGYILRTFGTMEESARVKELTLLLPRSTKESAPSELLQVWSFLTEGLRKNQSLHHLRLKGTHMDGIHSQGYFTLLQNAPPSLDLDRCQIGPPHPLTAEDDEQWQSSRLECLSLSYCNFGGELTLLAFLRKLTLLPALKDLRIYYAGESLSSDASREVTEILVLLLQQQTLEELSIEELQLSNISLFREGLEGNHSLKALTLTFDHWLDVEVIATALKHDNITLQSFRYNLDQEKGVDGEPRWGYGNIVYYLMLNQYGRELVRSDESTLVTLLGMVSIVMADDEKLESYPEGMTNMLYGLFRQRPSIWVSAATGLPTLDNKQTGKRKAGENLDKDPKRPAL